MAQSAGAGSRTIIDVIQDDHRNVMRLFSTAQRTSDPEQFHHLVATTILELVRHAVAEEQHLYPALREYLDDGDELADEELDEHGEMEQAMRYMERLNADDPELRPAFDELVDMVTQHVQEEEAEALPRLRRACPPATLLELGARMDAARRNAPAPPPPSVRDTAPMTGGLEPGAGLIDRVRDALAGRRV